MAKISKRLLLLLLVAALAATLTFSVVACNKGGDPVVSEGWYLSLSSSGYPVYDNVSSVPDAVAMKEEGGVWSISVTLAQNEQFFIKSTAGKSVGFDSVFSAATQLVAGDDGAIKVAAAGAYVLSYDGESITYSYTPPAAVQLTGIALSQTTLALEKGTAQQLVLSFLPEGATPVGVIWTSNDSDVASVTQEGVVSAVGYGTATITVTTTTGGFSANCIVSVVRHATSLYLSASQLSVVAGGSARDISVKVLPADSTELEYTASLTSGAEFAELSDDGEGNISVSGKAEGTAILSVSLVSNPEVIATCAITILPEGSVLVDLPASLDMKIGEETTLTASLENFGGTIKSIKWTVSGTAIAMQGNEMTATVTANDFGTATISIRVIDSENTPYTASCNVLVTEENFVIYGIGFGTQDWDYSHLSDIHSAEEQQLLFSEQSRGVYTLTRPLTTDDGFQIIFPSVGSFTEDVDGEQKWNKNIPSDLVSLTNYYNVSRSSKEYINTSNSSYFAVNNSGIYKITLDLTGETAQVYINVILLYVDKIELNLTEGSYTLSQGDSALISYMAIPQLASYADEDVSVELSSDFTAYNEYLSYEIDKVAKNIRVSVKSAPPQSFEFALILHIADKEKTMWFTAFSSGDIKQPVKTIAFEKERYEFNINNGMDKNSIIVKAVVNSDATNQHVRYSWVGETQYNLPAHHYSLTSGEVTTLNEETGEITSIVPGTFRIKATSIDDPEVFAYTDVLFYTDAYYFIGPSWAALSESITSLDGTGKPGIPLVEGSKTHYHADGLPYQDFDLGFLGMNDEWRGAIKGYDYDISNTDYTDEDPNRLVHGWYFAHLHCDYASEAQLRTISVDIDISTNTVHVAFTSNERDWYKGFQVYNMAETEKQQLIPGEIWKGKTFTFPYESVSESDLNIVASGNEEGWFSCDYDEATSLITVTCLKRDIHDDKNVTFTFTYKGCSRSLTFTSIAQHHLKQVFDETHHWYKCSDPGCEYATDKVAHEYKPGWEQDREDGEHYHACKDCGYTCDHAAHVFATLSQIDLNKDEIPVCSVCGEKLVIIENNVLVAYYGKANKIVLPDTLTEIGAHAFDGHKELRSITLPVGLKKIGDYAFRGCTGLPAMDIPASVTSIGQYAFSGFKSKITIPNDTQMYNIGSHAFDGCLGDIVITKLNTNTRSATYIEAYAFANSGITNLDFVCGNLSISEYAFENCTSLRTVTINSGQFEMFYAGAFRGCTSLEWVYIRNDSAYGLFRDDWWTTLWFWKFGDKAFDGCTSLEGIFIEKNAAQWTPNTQIGDNHIDPALSWLGDCSALYGKVYVYTEDGDKEYNFDEDHAPYIAGTWHYAGNVRDFDHIEVWD